MRLSPHRMFMPLLLSFSLTGGAVILLYFLNKKEDEEEQEIKSRKPNQVSIEIKIPRQKVPMIIGRGGLVLEKIKQSTSTNISFKQETDVNLPDRICLITGTLKNIKLAEKEIQCILNNQPLIETYEKLVPQRTINSIQQRGGQLLNQIQNSSNAKITILDHPVVSADSDVEKRVIIHGTAEQIADALNEIESRITEDKKAQIEAENDILTRAPRIKTSPVTSKNNVSKDVDYSKELFDNQDTEGQMEVYVSAMESPNHFYIQVIGRSNGLLKKLVEDMTAYYEKVENQELHVLRKIEIGQMVAAKFDFDKQWYRAEVIFDQGNDTYAVHFVDYGDHSIVNKKDVFELRTDFLSLRLQAIECSLAGIKPRDGEWSEDAINKFSELCSVANWEVRVAKIRRYKERTMDLSQGRREGSPIPCVDLYEKKDNQLKNINKELIELGFAVADDEVWSASSSTLSLRVTSPEVSLDHSNGSSSNGSSNNGFVKLERGEAAAAALMPDWKSPKKTNNPVSPEKPTVQFSMGSFLESEKTQSSIERKPTFDKPKHKPVPKNPFSQNYSKNKFSSGHSRNIVPAGYEDEDSEDDEYDGFEYN